MTAEYGLDGGGGNGNFPIWPKFPAEFECSLPSLSLPSAAVSVNGPTECPERRRRRRRPDSGRLKGRKRGRGILSRKGDFHSLPPSHLSSLLLTQFSLGGRRGPSFIVCVFQPKMKKTLSSLSSSAPPKRGACASA